MDSKNFAIGVLTTTAVILLVGLLLVNTRPEPAMASGMGASGGSYSIVVGKLHETEEMVYVIDAGNERMMTFTFDSGARAIRAVQPINLNDLRGTSQPQAQPQDPRKARPRGGSRTRRPRTP